MSAVISREVELLTGGRIPPFLHRPGLEWQSLRLAVIYLGPPPSPYGTRSVSFTPVYRRPLVLARSPTGDQVNSFPPSKTTLFKFLRVMADLMESKLFPNQLGLRYQIFWEAMSLDFTDWQILPLIRNGGHTLRCSSYIRPIIQKTNDWNKFTIFFFNNTPLTFNTAVQKM